MTLTEIKEIIQANRTEGRHVYEGLSSAEIGDYNRFLMFGENDEAFPESDEWAIMID